LQRNELGDVVILDADNNTIETPFDDLENLPADVVSKYLIVQLPNLLLCRLSYIRVILVSAICVINT